MDEIQEWVHFYCLECHSANVSLTHVARYSFGSRLLAFSSLMLVLEVVEVGFQLRIQVVFSVENINLQAVDEVVTVFKFVVLLFFNIINLI